jgi:TonB family protein
VNEPCEIYTLPVSSPEMRLGGPAAISVSVHAALLFLLGLLARQLALKPVEPVKVLEINVMGKEDLALKGTGADYSVGPMPDKTLFARPVKGAGKVVHGNTPRVSRALVPSEPAAPIPALTAKGPLFSSEKNRVEAGVGREKIFVSAPVHPRSDAALGGRGGGGDGLVGVTGAPIDLNAQRGTGGGGRGTSGFLSGGEGSVNGGAVLSRRGNPVLVHSSGVSDDPVLRPVKHTVSLEAPSDDFFSISGPLSGRKILKMQLPKYPRWAEEQGLEARIALRITVTARGRVKPDIIVEQTSGFPEFDDLVLDVVRKMIYAPLPYGAGNADQWGIATFNFNLKKGRPN